MDLCATKGDGRPAPELTFQPSLNSEAQPRSRSVQRASASASRALDDPRFKRFGWGPTQDLPFECVHLAIEAQARTRPHARAAEHEGVALTYGELDAHAERLAHRLSLEGVRHGDRVGVFLRRGLPMVVGIVAVLKLGAVYVPQDAGIVPSSMLRQVMDSAGMRVVLSTSNFIEALPLGPHEHAIDVEALLREPAFQTSREFSRPAHVNGSDLCFVLYTSGTTGTPNGVMVTHRNVCNIVLSAPGNLGIAPGMTVGQILNIGFDMAAWEILGCLMHGATLLIRGNDIAATAARVNVLIATPSILARLDPDDCPHIRVVALAGEPCPRPLADRWAGRCAFHNGCGPTEVTIVNTLSQYRETDATLTIGAPTPNNTVYVLDENLNPCPIGEVGEMWAGGDCVTAGYIGNPRLTAERYRPDPFLGGGRLMFRTRDLGRWTADGQLEHLGRVDDQVKVRGFRVELDAVSTMLERSVGCQRAVTLKVSDRDLAAFVTPSTVNTAEAREHVRKALPYYCVPTLVLALDTLPITERGKVDKRELLALAQRHLEGMANVDGVAA
jgi:amino acid adenylation domain-containing protein